MNSRKTPGIPPDDPRPSTADPSAAAASRSDPRRALGALGEAQAAEHLARQGYRIVGRNVRAGGVEIDLIVERARILAFVEVKTRSSTRFGRPEEAVDARKQARLVRGALAWMREHPSRRRRRPRFDVVSIVAVPGTPIQLRHVEGAFDAGSCEPP